MSARAGLKIGPSWLLEELSAGRPTQGCAAAGTAQRGPVPSLSPAIGGGGRSSRRRLFCSDPPWETQRMLCVCGREGGWLPCA